MIQCIICHYDKDTKYPVANVHRHTTLGELKDYFAETTKLNRADLKAWNCSNSPMTRDDMNLESYNLVYDDEPLIINMSTRWNEKATTLLPYYM